jgi:hypothetical protein
LGDDDAPVQAIQQNAEPDKLDKQATLHAGAVDALDEDAFDVGGL